jgi:hypothetical protein
MDARWDQGGKQLAEAREPGRVVSDCWKEDDLRGQIGEDQFCVLWCGGGGDHADGPFRPLREQVWQKLWLLGLDLVYGCSSFFCQD